MNHSEIHDAEDEMITSVYYELWEHDCYQLIISLIGKRIINRIIYSVFFVVEVTALCNLFDYIHRWKFSMLHDKSNKLLHYASSKTLQLPFFMHFQVTALCLCLLPQCPSASDRFTRVPSKVHPLRFPRRP